jgi:hypothetical protein
MGQKRCEGLRVYILEACLGGDWKCLWEARLFGEEVGNISDVLWAIKLQIRRLMLAIIEQASNCHKLGVGQTDTATLPQTWYWLSPWMVRA